MSRAEVEKRRPIRDARRLLHRVGDDDDRVIFLQLVHQLLDARSRDRVERARRLVHEQHLRLHRDGARDAEPLLLTAGKADARLAEIVFHLVPKGGFAQRILQPRAQDRAVAHAVELQADEDVVGDAHGRKRVRLLEHHADAPAHHRGVHFRAVKVLAVDEDFAGHVGAGDQLVQPVQAAQKRRFAAAARTDDGGDRARRNLERDVDDGVLRAVENIDAAGVHRRHHGRSAGRGAAGRNGAPAGRRGRGIRRRMGHRRSRGEGGRMVRRHHRETERLGPEIFLKPSRERRPESPRPRRRW